MDLFYREIGTGDPILILHGLYGSSDNWMSIGRELSSRYRVILIDQRNHGRSPHSTSHTYQEMVDDLQSLLNRLGIEKASLLGHSMGGKVVMQYSAQNPDRVNRLVVVDIMPFALDVDRHEQVHGQILSALMMLKPEHASSRDELDSTLSAHLPSKQVRQFLLKNLKRKKDGGYAWVMNVEALSYNLHHLMGGVLEQGKVTRIDVPTLFVKGEKSDHITPEGEGKLSSYFSVFRVVTIPNAGHWLHAENPVGFIKEVTSFLNQGA